MGRFRGWVDRTHGSKAWHHMLAGMVIGGISAGVLCLCVAVAVESPVLLGVGFVVFVGHLCYTLGTL